MMIHFPSRRVKDVCGRRPVIILCQTLSVIKKFWMRRRNIFRTLNEAFGLDINYLIMAGTLKWQFCNF